MLRVFASIAAIVLTFSTGCARSTRPGNLAYVQPTSDRPRAGNVYLLRGFIGIFSEGIDRLTQQINETGTRAVVYQDDQWSALARKIAQQYRDADDSEPLVLIGHSYGADDVVRIARELGREPASPAQARHMLGLRGREPGKLPA